MPRQTGTSKLVNRSVRGLITEASALSFPEDASQDELNVEIMRDGSRRRRRGVDVETDSTSFAPRASDLNIDDDDIWQSRVTSFKWEAVNGNPELGFIVVQVGPTVAFFNAGSVPITSGWKEEYNLELDQWEADDDVIKPYKCQFTSGNGKLFISHPRLDPIKVTYDELTDTMTFDRILVRIRDLEGLDDGLEVNERPTSLSEEHEYNLRNQGWYPEVVKMNVNQFYGTDDPIQAFASHIQRFGT